MTKETFLEALGRKIKTLPPEDRNRSLDFYAEMIDDRLEDGMSEEEAVADLGTTDDIAARILSERIENGSEADGSEKTETEKRPVRWWVVLLLILGAPVWGSLLIAAAAVIFSLLVTLWAVLISFYAVALAFVLSGVACVFGGIVLMLHGSGTAGLFTLGGGVFFTGFGILWFVLCHGCALGIVAFSRWVIRSVRKTFPRKGEAV